MIVDIINQKVETSAENPTEILGLQYTTVYITSSFAGIFAISCCIFVATYFYKHCIKQVNIPEGKGDGNIPNLMVGYSSLAVDTNQQRGFSGDSTYLEPVSTSAAQYNEIMDRDASLVLYRNVNN